MIQYRCKAKLKNATDKLTQVECINNNLIQNIVYNLKIPFNTICALVAILHKLRG